MYLDFVELLSNGTYAQPFESGFRELSLKFEKYIKNKTLRVEPNESKVVFLNIKIGNNERMSYFSGLNVSACSNILDSVICQLYIVQHPSTIFHSSIMRKSLLTVKGSILNSQYFQQSRPLSRQGSVSWHTNCDTNG
jgi:hypothetical protein